MLLTEGYPPSFYSDVENSRRILKTLQEKGARSPHHRESRKKVRILQILYIIHERTVAQVVSVEQACLVHNVIDSMHPEGTTNC